MFQGVELENGYVPEGTIAHGVHELERLLSHWLAESKRPTVGMLAASALTDHQSEVGSRRVRSQPGHEAGGDSDLSCCCRRGRWRRAPSLARHHERSRRGESSQLPIRRRPDSGLVCVRPRRRGAEESGMTKAAVQIVQFVHPGFEYHRSDHVGRRHVRSGLMAWKRGNSRHDRKFIVTRGSLFEPDAKQDHRDVDIVFWANGKGRPCSGRLTAHLGNQDRAPSMRRFARTACRSSPSKTPTRWSSATHSSTATAFRTRSSASGPSSQARSSSLAATRAERVNLRSASTPAGRARGERRRARASALPLARPPPHLRLSPRRRRRRRQARPGRRRPREPAHHAQALLAPARRADRGGGRTLRSGFDTGHIRATPGPGVAGPDNGKRRLAGTSQSGRRGSNPRPSAWEADALPTELRPRAGHSTEACDPF
jgi:hypothetical protein